MRAKLAVLGGLCLVAAQAWADGYLYTTAPPSGAPTPPFGLKSDIFNRMYFGTQQPYLPDQTARILFGNYAQNLTSGYTNQTLMLVHEQPEYAGKQTLGHGLHVYFEGHNNNQSNLPQSDNVGIYSNMINRGTAWSAGVHVETHTSADATAIGVNVESGPWSGANPAAIGINVMATNPKPEERNKAYQNQWSDQGINIQTSLCERDMNGNIIDPTCQDTGWSQGIRFNAAKTTTGIEFDGASSGTRAIHINGNYAVGLDMGGNKIRLNAGTYVCFENTDQVCMRYNAGKVEFNYGYLNGNVNTPNVVGWIDLSKPAKCMNC